MVTNIKLCSGAEAVRKFQRTGWSVARQKGSHIMMTKPGYQWTLSIPQHGELGPGLLRKLIRQAGLTIEEFNKL
jgi:predicted RNA binding protein YcfA (HicA-like mRNA interferase family)